MTVLKIVLLVLLFLGSFMGATLGVSYNATIIDKNTIMIDGVCVTDAPFGGINGVLWAMVTIGDWLEDIIE